MWLLIKGTRKTWDDHLTFELNLGNKNIRISTKSINSLRRLLGNMTVVFLCFYFLDAYIKFYPR